ncbi:MAG: hypothetical protein Kapaf2KO_22180 [Candidatus Kapaibacteriales bacterium]
MFVFYGYGIDKISYQDKLSTGYKYETSYEKRYSKEDLDALMDATAKDSEINESFIVLLNTDIDFEIRNRKYEVSIGNERVSLEPLFVFDGLEKFSLTVSLENTDRLKRYALVKSFKTLENLRSSNSITYFEPIRSFKIHSLDGTKHNVTNAKNDGEYPWYFRDMKIRKAWEKSTGNGAVVAIIDTGIELDHPELEGQVYINEGEDTNGNGNFEPWPSDSIFNGTAGDLDGIDSDGNGYVDDVIGYDFVDLAAFDLGDYSLPDPVPNDENGHGTAMSGLIAAKEEGIGSVGVAPGCRVMTIRSFDTRGNGESDDIARGILYAIQSEAKIINMSFGDSFASQLIQDLIYIGESMGKIMVSSSGNSRSYFEAYPSDYQPVLSVAGLNEESGRYGQSNYGSMIDISAPAVNLSTLSLSQGYRLSSGTSGAAAIVSGMAALIASYNPDLNGVDIRDRIIASASDLGEIGWDSVYANGIPRADISMESPRKARLFFKSIKHGGRYQLGDDIPVVADIITPQFDSYIIRVTSGYGNSAISDSIIPWDTISNGIEYGANADIGIIQTSGLKEGLHTLSLIAKEKNGIDYENRIYIYMYSDELEFTERQTIPTYFEGQPGYTVVAKTNIIANSEATVLNDITGRAYYEKGLGNYSTNNIYKLVKPELASDYQVVVDAYTESDRTNKNLYMTTDDDVFDQDIFDEKPYTLPFSNITGETVNQPIGVKLYPASSFEGLEFGRLKLYRYVDGRMDSVFTSDKDWLASHSGDMDGDGYDEILGSIDFQSVILSSGVASPFEFEEVFLTEEGAEYSGIGMEDIDGDGREEVLLFGTNRKLYDLDPIVSIINLEDNEYIQKDVKLGININGSLIPQNGLSRTGCVAKLKPDGGFQVITAGNDGSVYIYEVTDMLSAGSGALIAPVFVDEVNINAVNQYFSVGNFRSDEADEVAIMGFGFNAFTQEEEIGADAFTVRVIDYDSNYEISDPMYFGNIRNNLRLQWGISSGDIHESEGDELIVNAFPYCYVFGTSDSSFSNLFSFYGALSRSAIVDDIDGNGKAEFLVNTFGETIALEWTDSINNVPVLQSLSLITESSCILKWYPTPEGRYAVLSVDDVGNAFFLAETTENQIIIEDLELDKGHSFSVASIGSNGNSLLALPLSVFASDRIEPLTVKQIDNNTLALKYSQKFLPSFIGTDRFFIELDGGFIKSSSVYSDRNDKVYLTFGDQLPRGEAVLKVYDFEDSRGLTSQVGDLDISINDMGASNFSLVSAELSENGGLITLLFNKPVTSQLNLDNATFSIEPFGELGNPGPSFSNPNEVQINIATDLRRYGKGIEHCVTVSELVSDEGDTLNDNIGNTSCFSILPKNNMDSYAYPQPWKLSESNEIIFSDISGSSEIQVLDALGNILKTINETDNNGGVEWDGILDSGKMVKPGIYFYRVISEESNSDIKKFVVVQ